MKQSDLQAFLLAGAGAVLASIVKSTKQALDERVKQAAARGAAGLDGPAHGLEGLFHAAAAAQLQRAANAVARIPTGHDPRTGAPVYDAEVLAVRTERATPPKPRPTGALSEDNDP